MKIFIRIQILRKWKNMMISIYIRRKIYNFLKKSYVNTCTTLRNKSIHMETCSSHAKSKKKLIQPEVHSFQEIIGQKPLKKKGKYSFIYIWIKILKSSKSYGKLWKMYMHSHEVYNNTYESSTKIIKPSLDV